MGVLIDRSALPASDGVMTMFPESEPWTFTAETPSEHTVLKAQPRDIGPGVHLPALEPFVRTLAAGLTPRAIADAHRAIAARWGLTNASHFAHAFRTAYGWSPQEYRRRRRA